MVCPIAVDSSMGTAFPFWGTRAENAVKLVVALKLAALNRMSNVVRFGAFKCLILTANEQGATSNTSNGNCVDRTVSRRKNSKQTS